MAHFEGSSPDSAFTSDTERSVESDAVARDDEQSEWRRVAETVISLESRVRVLECEVSRLHGAPNGSYHAPLSRSRCDGGDEGDCRPCPNNKPLGPSEEPKDTQGSDGTAASGATSASSAEARKICDQCFRVSPNLFPCQQCRREWYCSPQCCRLRSLVHASRCARVAAMKTE